MEDPDLHNDIDEAVIFAQIAEIVARLLAHFKNLSNLGISLRMIGTKEYVVGLLDHGKMTTICNHSALIYNFNMEYFHETAVWPFIKQIKYFS